MATSNQKLQIRLAVIMSVTVLEFFLFQLPFTAVVLTTILLKVTGNLTMTTEVSTFAFSLWYIDSIINPLWTTLLTNKKKNKNNQVVGGGGGGGGGGSSKTTGQSSKGTSSKGSHD